MVLVVVHEQIVRGVASKTGRGHSAERDEVANARLGGLAMA